MYKYGKLRAGDTVMLATSTLASYTSCGRAVGPSPFQYRFFQNYKHEESLFTIGQGIISRSCIIYTYGKLRAGNTVVLAASTLARVRAHTRHVAVLSIHLPHEAGQLVLARVLIDTVAPHTQIVARRVIAVVGTDSLLIRYKNMNSGESTSKKLASCTLTLQVCLMHSCHKTAYEAPVARSRTSPDRHRSTAYANSDVACSMRHWHKWFAHPLQQYTFKHIWCVVTHQQLTQPPGGSFSQIGYSIP